MRPRMLEVRRWVEGAPKLIKVCIEPNHPRFEASLSRSVKDGLDEEGRFRLCEVLSGHFRAARERTDEDPILVEIGEDTYTLCSCRSKPGKVWIDFA